MKRTCRPILTYDELVEILEHYANDDIKSETFFKLMSYKNNIETREKYEKK